MSGQHPFPKVDSTALLAAQLELLVLRGTLSDSASRELTTFVLPPSTTRLTTDQAARALASLPKPAICSIQVGENNALLVDCKPVETAYEVAVHDHDVMRGERIAGLAREQGRPTNTGLVIMVRRGGEAMLVPEEAFVRWTRDYASLVVVAFSHGPPGADDEAGAGYVIRVHGVGPVSPDSIPPEILPFLPPGMVPGKPRKPF